MTKSTPSRSLNVQTPGDEPKQAEQSAASTSGSKPENEAPKAASTAPSDAVDLEALRAHIREEERAIAREEARAELGQAIDAAKTVISDVAPARHSKADYRNMRAKDIDPATLTAPVMTLDGYLCPPAPEAKK